MSELTDYKFCGYQTGDLDLGLENVDIISHAGKTLQCTLCHMLTTTVASVGKKMLMQT